MKQQKKLLKDAIREGRRQNKAARRARQGVSGFLCLGRLFQGQPNEAALCI